MRVRACISAVALALCLPAWSQQAPTTLEGAFTASAGRVTYRGKWNADVSSRTPDAVSGSWILVNERNDVVLQGTWSGRKSAAGWKGTWRARVQRGRSYTGTWTATEPGPGSKTFVEMLQAATKGTVAGTWSSAGFGGDWRLRPTL